MGGHRIKYRIWIYNKGKKTKKPQPKEDCVFMNSKMLQHRGDKVLKNYVVFFATQKHDIIMSNI